MSGVSLQSRGRRAASSTGAEVRAAVHRPRRTGPTGVPATAPSPHADLSRGPRPPLLPRRPQPARRRVARDPGAAVALAVPWRARVEHDRPAGGHAAGPRRVRPAAARRCAGRLGGGDGRRGHRARRLVGPGAPAGAAVPAAEHHPATRLGRDVVALPAGRRRRDGRRRRTCHDPCANRLRPGPNRVTAAARHGARRAGARSAGAPRGRRRLPDRAPGVARSRAGARGPVAGDRQGPVPARDGVPAVLGAGVRSADPGSERHGPRRRGSAARDRGPARPRLRAARGVRRLLAPGGDAARPGQRPRGGPRGRRAHGGPYVQPGPRTLPGPRPPAADQRLAPGPTQPARRLGVGARPAAACACRTGDPGQPRS